MKYRTLHSRSPMTTKQMHVECAELLVLSKFKRKKYKGHRYKLKIYVIT